MNQTVIGVFDTSAHAKSAKQDLINSGFEKNNIDFSSFGEKGYTGDNYNTEYRSSVTGFFTNLFETDETTANRYADVASRGTVVTVHTEDMADAKRAASILDKHGAIDFDQRASHYETATDGHLNDETIKVIEENVAVGKREVETGGVQVRSRIVEKPVAETLRLRYEKVFVRRTPVNRPATEADFANATGTITATETAEEAVVSKEARVVEEIEVGKEVKERTETINETVRETEVDVIETEGNVVRDYNDTVNTDKV